MSLPVSMLYEPGALRSGVVPGSAKKFDGVELHVAKQVADMDTGKLFGAVSVADIMQALEVRGITDIDKKQVILPEEPIKQTGSYEVTIQLVAGVEVPVKLEVKTAA